MGITVLGITAGINAVNASLNVAKNLTNLVDRPDIDVVAVKEKLHEMVIHAVSAQTALGEANQEIQDLSRQLQECQAALATKEDMEFVQDGNFYVRRSERDKGLLNPHCPVCFAHGRAVPHVPMATPGIYSCAIHENASYKTNAYREAERKREEQRIGNANSGPINRPRGPHSWMA